MLNWSSFAFRLSILFFLKNEIFRSSTLDRQVHFEWRFKNWHYMIIMRANFIFFHEFYTFIHFMDGGRDFYSSALAWRTCFCYFIKDNWVILDFKWNYLECCVSFLIILLFFCMESGWKSLVKKKNNEIVVTGYSRWLFFIKLNILLKPESI